jgi:hypothetical protein
MSRFYNPKRKGNLFDPNSGESFRLSRSKIDLFLNCPRCFYLDRRLGVGQPPGYPFNLNSAVDTLLKKEFDAHRAEKTAHPLMATYGIDAIPLDHELMDEWRDALRGGITYLHQPTNFFVTGGIDDIWVNPKGEFIIVDYKATAKEAGVSLDADWQIAYKRQVEIYQWLFRQNEFKVSSRAYFVYCNGRTDRKAFDGKLEFDISVLPYDGDDGWVESAIINAHQCLMSNDLPHSGPECDYCLYREAAHAVEK